MRDSIEDVKATVIIPTAVVDAKAIRAVQKIFEAHPWAQIILIPDALPLPQSGEAAPSGLPCEVFSSGLVSIAAKRNLGASHARGAILAFIDSDAWPDGNWLGNACRWLEVCPELGAVGGPNLSPEDGPSGERWVGAALKSLFVSGPGNFRKLRNQTARLIDDHLPTCNLVVTRRAFNDLNGMTESLEAGEDRDFCERLLLKGYKILFAPDVRVFHQPRSLKKFIAHRYRYGATLPPILMENVGRPGWGPRYIPLLLPAAFVVWLLAAPALWPLPVLGRLHRFSLMAYGGAILIEAKRLSPKASDTPGTLGALLIGNIVPGIGIWAQVLGGESNLSGLLRQTRP